MNKTNGVIEAAGASTSLYERELSPPINHRQSTIGFPSFLKWFKKNERENRKSVNLTNGIAPSSTSSTNQRYLKNNGIHINGKYNSNETLSPPSSPILGYLSPSSSCDSVLSTSTTGFAFIPPSNYQFGNNILLKKSIAYEPDTDTYRARLRKQKHLSEQDKRLDLTLRKKYQLYDADTLKSTDIRLGLYDNIQYTDRSLPHLKHKGPNNGTSAYDKKKHRRTASDSSKDKKSGQYVHVKGKRKAPPPPPVTNGNADKDEEQAYENLNQENYRTLGNTSTLSSTIARKKRRAPPPPPVSPIYEASSTNSILSEGLFDDKEIKALIEQTPDRPNTSGTAPNKVVEMKESTAIAKDCVETNAARRLTEQQKQILIDNIVKSHVPSNVNNRVSQILSSPIQVPPTAPDARELSPPVATSTSSISPRPWYKRPLSSNRDSAIPFKREIVLKTMEKRKSKYRDKDNKSSNIVSEARHSRSSIFDAGHKFGFFSRNKDPEAKDKEKRRSGIGIPNISELDREAAEILNREQANCRAKQKAENEKFYNPPEHLILQQNMFGSKTNISCSENTEDESNPKVTSTKDLISKFEANSSNVARITLNTSFIGRTEHFVEAKNQEKKEDASPKEESAGKTPPSSTGINDEVPTLAPKVNGETHTKENAVDKPNTEAKVTCAEITKILWTCPFCTLVNPNWRIICEACERIKPYDKKAAVVKEVKQVKEVKEVKASSQPKVTEMVEKLVKVDPEVVPKPEQVVQIVNKPIETAQVTSKNDSKTKKTEESSDWEKKAEKVMKYFMPRTSANALSKSSSETTVNKKSSYFRKSPSPSKLPVSTPKLDMQFKQIKGEQPDVVKSQNIPQIPEEKEVSLRRPAAEAKKELLDSSAIVTTVTPVFYAQTAFNKNMVPRKNISKSQEAINIEEVRSARLARFSKKLPAPPMETRSRESMVLEDHDSLEREKRRLREMIRAMNAKALAEKYPVIKKHDSTTELGPKSEKLPQVESVEQKPVETVEGHKLGAIKKIFTKTPSVEKSANQQIKAVSTTVEEKPKKVSSAAQTMVQMPDIEKKYSPERENKLETQNLYAAVQKPEAGRKMSEKNIFSRNETNDLYAYQPKFSEYDNMKVQEISRQLKSVKGRSEFKETLRNPFREMSRTDTIALNKIMRNLELAIAEGKDELAAQIATDLAKMKVALHVTKQRNESPPENSDDPNRTIIVDISVEDKVSKKGPIQITVMPAITIAELKQKMFMDFGIPVELQKWIINNQTVVEEKVALLQLGVKDKTAKMELFLSDTPDIAKEQKQTNLEIPLTSIAVQEDVDDDLSSNGSSNSHNETSDHDDTPGAAALPIVTPPKVDISNNDGWICPLCTLINLPYRTDCIACCEKRPATYKPVEQPISKVKDFVIPDELKRFLAGEAVQFKPEQTKNDLNKISPNRKSSEIFNIVASSEPARPPREKQIKAENTTPLQNAAGQNVTKAKYRGVDNYNPNRVEVPPISAVPPSSATGTAGRRYNKKNPAPPIPKQTNTNHYLELLSLDTTDYVPNVEEFECPICFINYEPGQGVILRDCLHSFCKECLQNTVQYSEEAEVKCPYMDTDYSCESVLQEREIKSIVTREIYELHLAKSVRVAEHKIENTFHCKTPNCRGWCIFEDNVNQFKCPVCKITNCLTCRVIHDGLTCKQYQDRLNSDCDSNIEAKRTKEMLQEMVEKGEAMSCPTCQVVMMKKWGCDWLKCSMCKTEICWVTRGPRWGPGGKGDTTAGCKCGVDGKKCHPKCNYCH